ncbi:MAG: TetR/AcrR family transcriptional regulator [Pseudomonadota bacterium]
MVQKKRPTRERILDTALALFNERRYGAVTTAMLANEVGIAEGNLWYHFNDRESLLHGIMERFKAQTAERLKLRPEPGQALANYVDYFRYMSEELSTYRFLYRDQADYGPIIGKLSQVLPSLYEDTAAQFRSYLKGMRSDGHLQIADDALELAVTNLLIIFRFYLEFAREAGLPEQAGSGAVRRAFRLHLGLFEDRLTPEAFDYLREQLSLDDLPALVL